MRAFQMWGAPQEHASHFLYTPRIRSCPAKVVPLTSLPQHRPDTHADLVGDGLWRSRRHAKLQRSHKAAWPRSQLMPSLTGRTAALPNNNQAGLSMPPTLGIGEPPMRAAVSAHTGTGSTAHSTQHMQHKAQLAGAQPGRTASSQLGTDLASRGQAGRTTRRPCWSRG